MVSNCGHGSDEVTLRKLLLSWWMPMLRKYHRRARGGGDLEELTRRIRFFTTESLLLSLLAHRPFVRGLAA